MVTASGCYLGGMSAPAFYRSIRTRSGYRAIMAGFVAGVLQLAIAALGWSLPALVAPFVPVLASWAVFVPHHRRTRARWVTNATWTTSLSSEVSRECR